MMTSRERVLKAIGHETTEIMPSTLYLEDGLRETLARRADLRESCVDYPNDTVRILWENIHTVLDETSYLDPFGVRYVRAGGGDQFVDPPMKEPDPGQIPRMKLLPEGEVERILATRREHPDKFIYYQFTMCFSERLWTLRGLEPYLMDLARHPAFVHEALDILLEMHVEALETLFTLPIDGVTFGDDFGSQKGLMISPDTFRTFYKAKLASLYEAVRRAGLVAGAHSCGDNTAIMGDYVEIGLQVFHPLQPECMDIAHIKREFGGDLTFRGGIGVQRALVHGTPDEVTHYVLESARVLSENGGYLLEPAKPLPHGTPLENAAAFIGAMRRARRYEF